MEQAGLPAVEVRQLPAPRQAEMHPALKPPRGGRASQAPDPAVHQLLPALKPVPTKAVAVPLAQVALLFGCHSRPNRSA